MMSCNQIAKGNYVPTTNLDLALKALDSCKDPDEDLEGVVVTDYAYKQAGVLLKLVSNLPYVSITLKANGGLNLTGAKGSKTFWIIIPSSPGLKNSCYCYLGNMSNYKESLTDDEFVSVFY